MLKRLWNWIVNFGRKPYVHPAPTERLKREFVAYLEAKDRDIRDPRH